MRHMCTMTFQVVGGSLLPEAVTWLFTSVLRGLQIHGQHETCNATLSYLAMLIYDNLVSLVSITADDSWKFYSYRYFYRDTILFLKCCWNHFIYVFFFFKVNYVFMHLHCSVIAASLRGAQSNYGSNTKYQHGGSGPV